MNRFCLFDEKSDSSTLINPLFNIISIYELNYYLANKRIKTNKSCTNKQFLSNKINYPLLIALFLFKA